MKIDLVNFNGKECCKKMRRRRIRLRRRLNRRKRRLIRGYKIGYRM